MEKERVVSERNTKRRAKGKRRHKGGIWRERERERQR